MIILCLLSPVSPVSADEPQPEADHLALGPAAFSLPRFPGAGRSRTLYFPFVDALYDQRWYMSASDLVGIYAVKTPDTQAGAALEWDPTRRLTQDDALLRGMPDVKETARLKLFASHTVYFATIEENVATDVLGRGQGTLSLTNLWLTAPLGRTLTVNLGPGLAWTDHRYMHSFYSVSDDEAVQNPLLHPFTAHAGITDLHMNGLIEWQPHAHYRVGLLAYVARLRSDAAASPIVVGRSQHTLMGWIAYQLP